MSKKIKLILVIIILLVLVFGILFLCNIYRVRHAKILVDTIDNVEVHSEIKLSDLIKSINGKLITDKAVKTDKIGEKKIKFKYINDDNIKVFYSFKINVVDTTAPVISEINTINVLKGSADNIIQRVFCADNFDKSPSCTIDGNYDLNEVGSYNVLFKAVDSANNVATRAITINVLEKADLKKEETVTYYDDIYSKFKNKNTAVGLDLSYYQGDIDYDKIKDKVDFVFLRIGYGKNRDNKYVLDSNFKEYIINFNKLKIPVGVYFFSYDENIKDAKESAKFVLKNIKKYKIDLPIVYDWENFKAFADYNMSLHDLNMMAKTFMNRVQKRGYKTMLYSSKNYLKYAWDDDYTVWLAHYNENSDYSHLYKMWQICDDGKIDGITSSVDIDIMYK